MTSRSWPGLVDLQVNGYAGIDVNADDMTAQTVVDLTRVLWTQGVTTYLPTVITAPEEKIRHVLAAVAEARRHDPLVAHSIAGVHVEGPALNADDGPRGAHDPAHLRDPDIAELGRWQHAAEGLVRIVTLAPERDRALEYIRYAAAHGIRTSIGHCAPGPDQVREAVAAGATLSTHLGNGTHRTLPRHPNHIWAQLAADALTAMFIADGHHLPADALTAMIRAKGVDRSILTSDSAALAGAAPGLHRTPVGGDVLVGEDGRLSLPRSGLLAGSGRSLLGCVAWATHNLPLREDEVVRMATANPARILGVAERAEAGGDRVDIEIDDDGIRISTVTVAGAVVHRS